MYKILIYYILIGYCPLRNSEIDDEYHFILKCPIYCNLYINMFISIVLYVYSCFVYMYIAVDQ